MRKALLAASAAVAVIAVTALILDSGRGGGGGGSSAQPPLPPAKRITGPLHTDGKQAGGRERAGAHARARSSRASSADRATTSWPNPDSCGDGYLPVTGQEFDDFQAAWLQLACAWDLLGEHGA